MLDPLLAINEILDICLPTGCLLVSVFYDISMVNIYNHFPVIYRCFSITIDREVLIFSFKSNQQIFFVKIEVFGEKNLIPKYK